ncbi:uncharacterized protein LOC135387799 isoform X2 [Ornithodoros turicata]
MFMRSCCGIWTLRKGTRYVASFTLASKLFLLMLYITSACRHEQILEFLNDTLRLQSPSSPLTEFWATFCITLILFLEMIASWMALRATLQENRWLLVPYITTTLWSLFSMALLGIVIITGQSTALSTKDLVTRVGPLFFVMLLRAFFFMVVLSYYHEMQEREHRQGNALPSVMSAVPPTNIDDLPASKRYAPLLLDYLGKPPSYEELQEQDGKTSGGLSLGLYF